MHTFKLYFEYVASNCDEPGLRSFYQSLSPAYNITSLNGAAVWPLAHKLFILEKRCLVNIKLQTQGIQLHYVKSNQTTGTYFHIIDAAGSCGCVHKAPSHIIGDSIIHQGRGDGE